MTSLGRRSEAGDHNALASVGGRPADGHTGPFAIGEA